MNKNQQTPIEQTDLFKFGAIIFVLLIILFFSLKGSSNSSPDSDSLILFWYSLGAVISLIIYMFIARWIFKINSIVSNQEKTNQLLENINNSILNGRKESDEPTDVNDPNYLKSVIDKLK